MDDQEHAETPVVRRVPSDLTVTWIRWTQVSGEGRRIWSTSH